MNETLSGKPKILFIQACKGNSKMQADDEPKFGPVPSHVFKVCSTFEGCIIKWNNVANLDWKCVFFVGYVSYRNAENGSVFIQTLCKELREHGKKRELRRIIDSVIDEVLKDKV